MAGHTPGDLSLDRWNCLRDRYGKQLLVNGVALPCGNHPSDHEATANARRIVQTWNAHDDLLAACEKVVSRIIDADVLAEIRAAVAKAKGGA